ncbi:MAG: PLP-dependent aminotransferase family protein [Candidatus Thermoplasmatota archaeon]|jgi:2-aminoadipate transaminase|nr:PLP-dependent aminotransferase family protein [Candidatus Thermoplasmatota archaeon]MCL5799963.1 PLP-dependent aminotransferase family protein [Candidatus Thermoplasmatota archaeon]
MQFKFSALADAMKPSEIRELLKYVSVPGLISFGGGMPHPSSFPVNDINTITSDLLLEKGRQLLQYGSTQGYEDLRVQLVKLVKETENISTDKDHFVLTAGSQEALYSVSKIMTTPGEEVLCEAPTYIGTISAFRANGTVMRGIPMDENGILTEKLEEKIKAMKAAGKLPKFIYLIPTFQNPSGISLSLDRRKHVLELASRYQIPIVEDNPYGELRYSGNKLPSLKSLDKEDLVIYMSTFSKILSPGLRVGFTCAPDAVVNKMNLLKQATNLATNTLAEAIAAEYLKRDLMRKNMPAVVKMYREKRDTMIDALETNFGSDANWSHPDGGMFLWLALNDKINTTDMLKRAIEKKVAYVSGSAFYPNNPTFNTMRLNFTYSDNDQIVDGISRLAKVAKEEISLIAP